MGGALDGQLETCATQHPRGDTCPSLVSQMALKEALRPSQHRRLVATRRTCALARPAVGEAVRRGGSRFAPQCGTTGAARWSAPP